MLKKTQRLSVGRTKGLTRSIYCPFFTIRFGHNGLDHNRFGFVISKKIDSRAVVRNKLKRAIIECIQKIQKQLNTGYDMVFFLKKQAAAEEKSQLCQQIHLLFQKQGLLI